MMQDFLTDTQDCILVPSSALYLRCRIPRFPCLVIIARLVLAESPVPLIFVLKLISNVSPSLVNLHTFP
jgi:hypothetical protein